MNKSVKTIIKLNLKNIKAAYITTIACAASMASNYIITEILVRNGENMAGNEGISFSWTFWVLPVLAAILIPARHFKRIISLGGKREDFFRGCLATYAILAGIASLLVIVSYYTVDRMAMATGNYGVIWAPQDVFGWNAHGPVVFFLQQFAFLFLTAAFTHTFSSVQGRLLGWIVTAAAIAVISVFPPIEALRNILIGYIYLIMFNPNALLQIAACLIIGLAFYWLSKPVFARKAI